MSKDNKKAINSSSTECTFFELTKEARQFAINEYREGHLEVHPDEPLMTDGEVISLIRDNIFTKTGAFLREE